MISIKPNDLRISEARLKQALKETDSELHIFLKDAINKFSQVFVNTAKINAKGMNVAKGLQSHENKLNPLEGGLSTKNMFFYAPYVEFGTRGQTKVPQGFEEIALKYKGKSKFKSEASFKDSLKQWIKKKLKVSDEEAESLVFPIMMKILKVGTAPKPFMVPAYHKSRKFLDLYLKKNIKKALR
tara:strand:- start:3428 stop:3979 length:552 start_codon:yes stop_codon:yes gene_type:complete